MGVGKGTIARGLVKNSSMFAIDTDDLIESMENRTIKKIFATEGEPYFRDLEKKTAVWLENNVSNTIISTGGGFYKQENINNIGKIVYLKSSFQGILDRINACPNADKKLKKRPLLQNLDEAIKLYDSRVSDYEKVSNIIIDVEKKPLEDIVEEILGQI
ncbi:MAG: shikimate kinase [Arcobacter sp.]|nr:shikimate kinase [Arcobacter sp.]